MKTPLLPILLCALALGFGPQAHAQAPATGEPKTTSSGLSPEDVQRWRAYNEQIAAAVKDLPRESSLAELLRPVLQAADKRSEAGRAADENRVALMAVAFYVNGWPTESFVPEATAWPRPARRALVLGGRHDLAQHFILSALISAAAGAPIADAAGLYKEMSDARGGSGFSFSDIAADRSGTFFGQLATRSTESARRLQAQSKAGLAEADLMPSVDGLADNMSEAEFTRRFGGVGTPAYKVVINEIERRVSALALFR